MSEKGIEKKAGSGPVEVQRWKPMDIESMFNEMLSDFWSPRWPLRAAWPLRRMAPELPAMDLYDEKDELIVKAEIPGMTREQVDVSIEGTRLTIRGEKKKEEEAKGEDYFRSERTFGSFARSIELPMAIQSDKVTAKLQERHSGDPPPEDGRGET